MRIVRVCSLALVLLVSLTRPASADLIFVSSSFSGGTFDAIGMTPFDSSLGTLDKVLVSITGTLSVSGTTLPNLVPVGSTLLPAPYSYRVDVSQDFEGLAGGYFDLNDHSAFSLPGLATGAGEPFTLTTAFSYAFDFDDISDLIGFAIPSVSSSFGSVIPPFTVSAARADFTGTGVLEEVDLFQIATAATIGAAVPSPLIGAFSADGAILVTYDYTPTPAAVPEPAVLALLGVAGVMAARRGRRRRVSSR